MVINPTFGQTLGQTVESNYASSGGFCLQTTKQASNGLLVENKLWHYGILLLSTNGLFPRASLISTHKDLKACAHFPLFSGHKKTTTFHTAMAPLLLLALAVTLTVAEEDVCTLVQPRNSRPKIASPRIETSRSWEFLPENVWILPSKIGFPRNLWFFEEHDVLHQGME